MSTSSDPELLARDIAVDRCRAAVDRAFTLLADPVMADRSSLEAAVRELLAAGPDFEFIGTWRGDDPPRLLPAVLKFTDEAREVLNQLDQLSEVDQRRRIRRIGDRVRRLRRIIHDEL